MPLRNPAFQKPARGAAPHNKRRASCKFSLKAVRRQHPLSDSNAPAPRCRATQTAAPHCGTPKRKDAKTSCSGEQHCPCTPLISGRADVTITLRRACTACRRSPHCGTCVVGTDKAAARKARLHAIGSVTTMRNFVPCQGRKSFYEGSASLVLDWNKKAS